MLQLMLLPYRTPVAKLQQESVNSLQTTMKVLVLCAILYGAGKIFFTSFICHQTIDLYGCCAFHEGYVHTHIICLQYLH